MADDGDQITLTARLHPQDAEAAVLVVEGDAFDAAGEVLALGCGLPSPPAAYLPSSKIAGR
jgi:hypothetical protein